MKIRVGELFDNGMVRLYDGTPTLIENTDGDILMCGTIADVLNSHYKIWWVVRADGLSKIKIVASETECDVEENDEPVFVDMSPTKDYIMGITDDEQHLTDEEKLLIHETMKQNN